MSILQGLKATPKPNSLLEPVGICLVCYPHREGESLTYGVFYSLYGVLVGCYVNILITAAIARTTNGRNRAGITIIK